MAYILTARAQALSQQIAKTPQLIFEVEGIDTIFGAFPIFEMARWDGGLNWDDDNAYWDGLQKILGALDYISFEGGTDKSLSQQLQPDKFSTSSVSTFNIELIDKDNRIAKIFALDTIGEILGRKASVYLSFLQASFPEDAIPLFRGFVDGFDLDSGTCQVSISHPDNLRRQTIYNAYQSNLTGAINNLVTTINVKSTGGLYASQDTFTTYVRVDDEIMLLSSIVNATQISVIRGQLGTIAASHDIDADITSVFKLIGSPLDLALKVMLSNEGNTFFESLDVPMTINFISPMESLNNALIFDYFNIQERTGLVVGDIVELYGGSNIGTYFITGFNVLDNGSAIIVDGPLVDDSNYSGSFRYKSKYNVFPDGLNMMTNEVDVEGFESIKSSFFSTFIDYDFELVETIDNAKDWIDEQLFFPMGLYSLPRKARSSVKMTSAPLSVDVLPNLNTSNITNIENIKVQRSTAKYLYNNYTYVYEKDLISDKFLVRDVLIDQVSKQRMNVGYKGYKVESLGLRASSSTTLTIQAIVERLKDRYRFAPLYVQNIQLLYKAGFNLEVGDVIPFGGETVRIPDPNTGKRGLPLALYEVANKKLEITTGTITVDLLQTAFQLNARYGVISLSSYVGSGSTTSRIRIDRMNVTGEFLTEADKWRGFAGERVRIRSDDYVFDYTTKFIGIDPSDNNFLLIEPIASAPLVDYIIEIPVYDDSSANVDFDYKLRFVYLNRQATITSVVGADEFDVDDASLLVIGSEIYVHSDDYTRDSFGNVFVIQDIIGNTIYLDAPLDFTPLVGDRLENSNYLDGGFPYLII